MLKEIDKATFAGCLPARLVTEAVHKNFDVFVESDLGNFTVAVIRSKTGQLFSGVSKRNPGDKPSETGVCVALVRAWRAFLGQDPGYNRQRPVSKKEAKQAAIRDILTNQYEKQNAF